MFTVDCSKDGNHIVVARKSTLSILSSDFKETCCMSLLFQLWSDGSDSEGTSIKGKDLALSFAVYVPDTK